MSLVAFAIISATSDAGSASPEDSHLVLATWGLVVATALLFLAAIIPALAQFRDWRNARKVQTAELIPILHGIRTTFNTVLFLLQALLPSPNLASVADIHQEASSMLNSAKELNSFRGLSVDQRLELTVLNSHLKSLVRQLELITTDDRALRERLLSALNLQARLRMSIAFAECIGLSLDRLDSLFASVRKRYKGRSYADEVILRMGHDSQEAEKIVSQYIDELLQNEGK